MAVFLFPKVSSPKLMLSQMYDILGSSHTDTDKCPQCYFYSRFQRTCLPFPVSDFFTFISLDACRLFYYILIRIDRRLAVHHHSADCIFSGPLGSLGSS